MVLRWTMCAFMYLVTYSSSSHDSIIGGDMWRFSGLHLSSSVSAASSVADAPWLSHAHDSAVRQGRGAVQHFSCRASVQHRNFISIPAGKKRQRRSAGVGSGAFNLAPSLWTASYRGGIDRCRWARGLMKGSTRNGPVEEPFGENSVSYSALSGSGSGSRAEDRGRAAATLEQRLRESLAMTDAQAQGVAAQCGTVRPGVAEDVLAFLRGDGLDLTVDQMRLVVLKAPRLLEMSVPESLSPRVDWWLRQAGLGLTRKALGKMATKCPEVLLLAHDAVLSPIVLWLLVEVKMSRTGVAKLLASYPQLLTLDLEGQLRRRHRWLTSDLGLQTKDARRIVTIAPQVLHASKEETLRPACDWLARTIGGAGGETSVGGVVTRSPELLLTCPGAMDKCLVHLSEVLLEGNMQQASALFERQPALLLRSGRLEPLVTFMTLEMKASLPQAREAIVNDVTLLEFDMNGRVFPRLDAVRKAGIVGDVANGRTPQASLREMMRVLGRFSDARFVKWLARERVCPEAVEEHRGEAVPHKHL
ncbi:unnamed protein product [Ascophyllum nodosum]